MASSTTITLKEFNLQEALNGASIGFSTTGAVGGTVSNYVLNFRQYTQSKATWKYVGEVGKTTYYFDENGACSDSDTTHQLYLVDATIASTTGTEASRGDGSSAETISISALQPREQFACYALQGRMYHIDNPLLFDDGQITQISAMAFQIAKGMLAAAADARAATSTEPPSEEIEIDKNDVSSTTDKILYNLNENISKLIQYMSNIQDAIVTINNTGIEVKEMPDITLSGTPDVYVTNMISEPVSVTGTVSVDNFPNSGGTTE